MCRQCQLILHKATSRGRQHGYSDLSRVTATLRALWRELKHVLFFLGGGGGGKGECCRDVGMFVGVS